MTAVELKTSINEDLNLLEEGRYGEIEALNRIDWEKLREKEYANDRKQYTKEKSIIIEKILNEYRKYPQ